MNHLQIFYQNELLLDRLVLFCSSAILADTNVHNDCYILSKATLRNICSYLCQKVRYRVRDSDNLNEGSHANIPWYNWYACLIPYIDFTYCFAKKNWRTRICHGSGNTLPAQSLARVVVLRKRITLILSSMTQRKFTFSNYDGKLVTCHLQTRMLFIRLWT